MCKRYEYLLVKTAGGGGYIADKRVVMRKEAQRSLIQARFRYLNQNIYKKQTGMMLGQLGNLRYVFKNACSGGEILTIHLRTRSLVEPTIMIASGSRSGELAAPRLAGFSLMLQPCPHRNFHVLLIDCMM
jgi:hypothetical protein